MKTIKTLILSSLFIGLGAVLLLYIANYFISYGIVFTIHHYIKLFLLGVVMGLLFNSLFLLMKNMED